MAENIESHLIDKRVFKPSTDFARGARIRSLEQYRRLHRDSINNPEKFWAREASELVWSQPWKKVLQWKAPFAKWFVGGKLNLSENCLDRHLTGPRRNKVAILWEGEPGDKRALTYQQLHRDVWRHPELENGNTNRDAVRLIIYLPTYTVDAIGLPGCTHVSLVNSGGY